MDFEIGYDKFNFVRVDQPDNIVVWHLGKDWKGWNLDHLMVIKATSLNSNILKRVNAWDKLSEGVRAEIEKIEADVDYVIKARMEKARKSRKSKYANVPKEATCIECGEVQVIPPSVLVKRAEKWANGDKTLTVFDFLKQFKCQKCCPSRGRKSNGLASKIELVCKCGAKVVYSAKIVKKTSEKKGITVEAYVKGYRCQKCNPTIGRGRRKKERR